VQRTVEAPLLLKVYMVRVMVTVATAVDHLSSVAVHVVTLTVKGVACVIQLTSRMVSGRGNFPLVRVFVAQIVLVIEGVNGKLTVLVHAAGCIRVDVLSHVGEVRVVV
jgi:hypothetical protein